MKKTSRKTTLGNFIKAILIMLLLAFMSVELINANNRIIFTAITFANISFEIQDYNESDRKSDERTVQIEKLCKKRAEMYNSDDWLISTFSTSNSIIKIIFLLFAFASYIAVIIIWLCIIAEIIEKVGKKIKKNCKV